MRHRAVIALSVLVCVPGLLLAQASPPPPAKYRVAHNLTERSEARAILEAVNKRYTALRDIPREMVFHQTVTTRVTGLADMIATEKIVAHTLGLNARVETVQSHRFYRHTVTGELIGMPNTLRRQVWTHDGRETRSLYEADPEPIAREDNSPAPKTIVHSFRIRHDALPPNAPRTFRSPMETIEFDDVFMNARYYVFPSIVAGKPVWVIQSAEPIVANDSSTFHSFTVWVERDTLLCVRVDSEMTYRDEKGAVTHISTEQHVENVLNASLDAALDFSVDLPPDAKDITDTIAAAAAKKTAVQRK